MTMDTGFLLQLGWLGATVCVIAGLRRLVAPRKARRGVHLIALGLGLALAATFGHPAIGANLALVLIAMLAGGALVWRSARRASAADSAPLIALCNALGGAAGAAIALSHLLDPTALGGPASTGVDKGIAVLALLLGAIAAGGSGLAWWRMSRGREASGRFAQRQLLYLANAAAVLLLGLVLSAASEPHPILLTVFLIACVGFGLGMTAPIAQPDMPVLIALYNAVAGLGVALDGMLIDNPPMIVAGSLVFAAGSLLMRLTARAMNRRLGDVMYSGLGLTLEQPQERSGGVRMNRIDASEAAIALGYAGRVLIVPGYGMAVSRSHHKLRELTQLLEERGVRTEFALHPVAGRLPGHMNVLLAEAGVPYDRIVDAQAANADMAEIDVALVVGADDIVNPAARGGDGGELQGLAIIDADRAARTIVLRRDDGQGHAGVANPLMTAVNTRVMVGDALTSVQGLIAEIKQLD